MDTPFLEKLARLIRDKHAGKGNRLCIVMPNRRAGLFLKHHLAPPDDTPVWAPSIFSIEDFVAHLTGLTIPDPLALMAALYHAHQQVEKEHPLSFDEFYGRARGLVHDFEEVDQYLINPQELFGFLSETKALSLWNFNEQPLTDFETQYLAFFNSLPEYYKYYTEYLSQRKLAYHGMGCRILATNKEQIVLQPTWDHVIFAGFNALTPAQLQIIRTLIATKHAEILWDADAYYMNNELQEAGRFLRRYKNDPSLGTFGAFTDCFKDEHNFTVAGVPRMVGQANMAGNLLKEILDKKETDVLNKTAVVLADESLLLPLLNAIPSEAGQFNITMGFPLTQSPIYLLFAGIIEMHVNASESKNPDEKSFYHKDLIQILQHPYAHHLADVTVLKSAREIVLKNKNSFYSISDFRPQDKSEENGLLALELLLKPVKSVAGLINLLAETAGLLKSGIAHKKGQNSGEADADKEILFSIALIINRLQKTIVEPGLATELRTLRTLFQEAAQQMPVAFYGEPLRGIQVMGMLETRTLDFENLILLSANEGTLPLAKSLSSFIPFEIRTQFGMPTHYDQQAVFAYHFYRLLQRSKNAWLIYNSEADQLGGGEKSRFITQLLHELPVYSSSIRIKEVNPGLSSKLTPIVNVEVAKDQAIINRLSQMAEYGFSPSALTIYLKCTLQFYFSKVLRLAEPDAADDSVDFRTLGDVVHKVMQKFYEPLVNQKLLEADLVSMKGKVPQVLKQAFKTHFPGGDIDSGRNHLIFMLARKWLHLFIVKETEALNHSGEDIFIRGIEQELERILPIPKDADLPEIKVKGKADRIDQTGDEIRIIDYKTGKVSDPDVSINSGSDFFNNDKTLKEKAFQLMFYQYLAAGDENLKGKFKTSTAGILSFRALNTGFFPLNIKKEDHHTALAGFEEGLQEIMLELFNANIPFSQVKDEKVCLNCNFKTICQRNSVKRKW